MDRAIIEINNRKLLSVLKLVPSRFRLPISLIAAYVARVLLPIIAPDHYTLWLGMAQATWLAAFALFVWVYAPILVKARADGMPG